MVQEAGVCQWTLHERPGDFNVVSLQRHVLPESARASSEEHRDHHPHCPDSWRRVAAISGSVVGPDSPQIRQEENIPPDRSQCRGVGVFLYLARVHRVQ